MILEYISSLLEEGVCEESVAPASVCWAVTWVFSSPLQGPQSHYWSCHYFPFGVPGISTALPNALGLFSVMQMF